MPWYQWLALIVGIYLFVGLIHSVVVMWKTKDDTATNEPGEEPVMFLAIMVLWLPADIAVLSSERRLRRS